MSEHVPAATALVVLVPEAEPLVGGIRAELDSSAADGMPAHVTVLWPFVPAAAMTPGDLDRLAAAVWSVRAFRARFRTTARFGDTVLWLAPEPSEPFAALTRAVESAFPAWPAYGGAIDEPIPHLTVADGGDRDDGLLDAAESSLPATFDVTSVVREVAWMERSCGRWLRFASFPLGS